MQMKKLFLFFVSLLCAASMWAQDPVVEGPWTQLAMDTHVCDNDGPTTSMTFAGMNHQTWEGTINAWQDGDGVGYTYSGNSSNLSLMGIFSTYKKEMELPSYSYVKLDWKYQLRSKCTQHHSSTCLYALQGTEDDINSLEVDFTNHYTDSAGAEYLLDCYVNKEQDGKTKKAGEKTATFELDNLGSDVAQTKAWYLLLTHLVGSSGAKSGLKEWGSFKSVSLNTTWIYRTIITFDANGGTGMMEDQIIDGSGKLSPNALVNGDLIFKGWATEKGGPVVYINQAMVDVTESNRGPQVLYAVWNDSDEGLKEGPWTQLERATESCARANFPSIYFNRLDNTQWDGTIGDVNDDKGTGYSYSFSGACPSQSKLGIFSTYKAEASVPSYTSMNVTWHYKLGSKSHKHHSTVCLYALPDVYDDIKNLAVDFSNGVPGAAGAQNRLAYFNNTEQDGNQRSTAEQTVLLLFDNREEGLAQTKKWFMLMTYVMESGEAKSGLNENGVFKNISADTTWTYRKIITFHPRGGTGTMNNQNIDNSGCLPPNMFIRDGYTFAGWATTADGDVAYADGAPITATADDKGPDTLYAVWAEGVAPSPVVQGSWTQIEWRSAMRSRSGTPANTFNQLDNTKWEGTITGLNNEDGTGYNFAGQSPIYSKMGIFSTYENKQNIPSYSRLTMTWKYRLYSKSTKHHSAVCLYAMPYAYDSIANLAVDFSNHHDTETGAEHLLSYYLNSTTDGNVHDSGEKTATLVFDNLDNKDGQTLPYYLMLTYMMESNQSAVTPGLNESGYFKSVSVNSSWTYRKIITFDANDGEDGEMADQIIDGSANLTANAFTREGYTFAGWATDPIGEVIYADGAEITVDQGSKGLDTLYAKWNLEGEAPEPQVQGPWTQLGSNTLACAKNVNPAMAYSRMDGTTWEDVTITPMLDNDGVGFMCTGSSPANGKMGIYSIYKTQENLPAYTSKTMTWKFQLRSKSTKHHSITCLYGLTDSSEEIENVAVDFTNHYTSASGAFYLLDRFSNSKQDGKTAKGKEKTIVITLDNLDGDAMQTKAKYMLMTYVIEGKENDGTTGLKEWGSFRSVKLTTSYTYRKIITFDANGGEGTMAEQIIDNSGKLSANIFHRDGYTFAGWATDPAGSKAYDDQVEITATAMDKGPVTLYALWVAGEDPYSPRQEGPWTQLECKTMKCDKSTNPSISYAGMNTTQWSGTVTGWKNEHGTGYSFEGSSSKNSKMGIFSTYMDSIAVPSYSRISMTWTYRLRSVSTKHHSYTCLYGLTGAYDDIVNLAVDFSNHYDTQTGSAYLWAQLGNTEEDGDYKSSEIAQKTIDFDNREGSTAQTKTWYLMLTHVMESGDAKSGLNEWGSLIHQVVSYDTCYYKYITLYPNGGMGQMKQPIIGNSGNLPANSYTRAGYTFAGWALSADGPVAYANGAAITATKDDKGHVTLYAVWTPNQYAINYELNGGTEVNPVIYAVNAGLTLADPTKEDYTFLGWTGSNGSVPQTGVAIAKGSTGNKSFTAHWMSNAVTGTITKISAIGSVKYPDSEEAIADARTAYNALSEEEQALVTNIGLLTAAEDAYITAKEKVEGNTTINFVRQDDTPFVVQTIQLDYPEAPVIAGYTFQYWQTIAEDVTAGTIRLQAVYMANTPTDIEDVDAKANAEKFIRNGNLYILKEEFIYTINGQKIQ